MTLLAVKKTKNDYFEEIFITAAVSKNLKTRALTFDSRYAYLSNLKLIYRANWTFFYYTKKQRNNSSKISIDIILK
ncbi:hypothetical protein WAF17_21470 [Bernardetia sp. ABR2-2B]|uniref:hypothetical protein n=1 Tax=Bernardetia sp. ABR2-2B TaxID=3127472 RepID=UPI0030CC5F4D